MEIRTMESEKHNETNLQSAFELFRQRKLKAIKQQSFLKKMGSETRRTSAHMQQLRQKFIDAAKSYYGVPYAKKYHEAGTEKFNSPLFLDCCGLVRQCVNDLKEEFGFTIGRWNQAYQYDTLPLRKASHTELVPGDLIFYSATYNNPRAKPQRHNMVHVEIFIGGTTGEQSIGARWQRGGVQMFDTFKFESTLYHDITWHYCSLDTWLEGICESHCDEHEWRRLTWVPGSKSIFSADDDETEEGYTEMDEAQGSEDTVKEAPKTFFASGNGSQFVHSYLVEHDWVALPKQFASTSKFTLKWKERADDGDFRAFKHDEQLINHIPNIHLLTNDHLLLNHLRTYAHSHPEFVLEETIPKTFRLDINGEALQFFNQPDLDSHVWHLRPTTAHGPKSRLVKGLSALKNAYMGAPTTATTDVSPSEEERISSFADIIGDLQVPLLDHSQRNQLPPIFVQQYLSHPLLLNGRKCDARMFVLITGTNPSSVYFHPGYIRCCSEGFTLDDLTNSYAHKTNLNIQRKHGSWSGVDGVNAISLSKFSEILVQQQTPTAVDMLIEKMKTIIVHALGSVMPLLQTSKGYFQVLSFDFSIDTNFKPLLVEVHNNPSFMTDAEALKAFIPSMMTSILDIVTRETEPGESDLGGFVKIM